MSWVLVIVEYEGCGSHECIAEEAFGPYETRAEAEAARERKYADRAMWGIPREAQIIELGEVAPTDSASLLSSPAE